LTDFDHDLAQAGIAKFARATFLTLNGPISNFEPKVALLHFREKFDHSAP
jgi:hypothetical protein